MENEPSNTPATLAAQAFKPGAAEQSAQCAIHEGWLVMQPDGTPFAVFFVHSKLGAWLSLSVAKGRSGTALADDGWLIARTRCCSSQPAQDTL